MDSYRNTRIWKNSLGITSHENQASINKIREVFFSFREKVALLSSEISRDLPGYTVHDISHIDALWEMADCICGEDFKLNPIEGFVLGGAFLLHDLGMSLSAYPNGVDDLESTDLWKDTVARRCKTMGLKVPEKLDYLSLEANLKEHVLSDVLRALHAPAAEKLATVEWINKRSPGSHFLIDDVEIRQTLGRIIGKIAHSHWWGIDKIEKEFSRTIGAPSWSERSWTIDPLKIACILRVSDAAHIDSRRAPSFLRTLRKLGPESDLHWCFQEKLQKPYLSEDSLFYTSGYEFPHAEAPAWWLCYEALNLIDKELRQTDALLADRQMNRFKAKRVFGIESPERLSTLIRTSNWEPIDAFIHIGDLPRVIRALGGEELYGKNVRMPIRELIQNSSDAIRARRALEKRDISWGRIIVRSNKEENDCWIEIEDNGLGMSLDVIKRYLFEFGTSYWNSELMQEEHPGLASCDVLQTGKYGIGFYSVFMIGQYIKITTRKCSHAQSETYIVEFMDGLNSRPIIRKAEPSEYLLDGGTKIRAFFENQEKYEDLLRMDDENSSSLNDVILSIAPALDCSVLIKGIEDEELKNDFWKSCSNKQFSRLLAINSIGRGRKNSLVKITEYLDGKIDNADFIFDDENEVIGRAFLGLTMMSDESVPSVSGSIVVGGLVECHTSGICGIVLGETTNAARDNPKLKPKRKHLSIWASKQANKIENTFNKEQQFELSQLVRMFGGQPSDIPVAKRNTSFYSYNEMKQIIGSLDEFIVCDDFVLKYRMKHLREVKFKENVFFSKISSSPGIVHNKRHSLFEDQNEELKNWEYLYTNMGYFIDIVVSEWGVLLDDFLADMKSQDRSKEEIEIGISNGDPILEDCYIFSRKKPNKRVN